MLDYFMISSSERSSTWREKPRGRHTLQNLNTLESSSSRTEQHNHHFKCCFCCRKSDTEEGHTVEASENDGKEGDQDHELDGEEEENMMERTEDVYAQPRLISEGGVINSIMITRSFGTIYSSSYS